MQSFGSFEERYPNLRKYSYRDVAPQIGGAFADDVSLKAILNSPEELKELAHLISSRCVVFFKNQNLSTAELKRLAQSIGVAGGKPESSGLHKHVSGNAASDKVEDDEAEEVIVISPTRQKKLFTDRATSRSLVPGSHGWHSDAYYEPVPSDYTVLQMRDVPPGCGGDTLWASGYEVYDRLSKRFQDLLDGTTARVFANRSYPPGTASKPRGSPLNNNTSLTALQPVVRTNPVTNWRSIYGAAFTLENGWINELTPYENNIIKEYLLRILLFNSDLQVRYTWSAGDIAIWDNRCTFHKVNNDYQGRRSALRVVSIGEKAYFDPNSVSRREALGIGFTTPKASL